MNVQRFANVGDYLTDLMRAVNRQAALKGASAFSVEVRDGINEADVEALR